jgi:gliding motility-associated lipoprotein GldH
MRGVLGFAFIAVFLLGCDGDRVYDKNVDFDSRSWLVTDKPVFEFTITDTVQSYDLFCNLRNSLTYPYARIFITWSLRDSTNAVLEKKLVSNLLFDDKTGEPFGNSGLGDIYDHTISLKSNYKFPYPGKFSVSFEQYMRTDTLSGVLAVGLRVGRNVPTRTSK